MAPSLDLVLACFVAILPMPLILALVPGFQPIDFQVLRATPPALEELTAENQSYAALLALQVWLTLGFLAFAFSRNLKINSMCSDTLEARHLLQPTLSTLVRLRLPVVKPLSFPIYHILVIIFHSRQTGLLRYVDSHGTSDPESLEKSRGTLP